MERVTRRVDFVDLPAVVDVQLSTLLGDLRKEAPELFAERRCGPMMASVFASMFGVLTAFRIFPSSSAARIPGDLNPDTLLRFGRRSAKMRCEDQVGNPAILRVSWQRLLLKNIERRAGQSCPDDRFVKRLSRRSSRRARN